MTTARPTTPARTRDLRLLATAVFLSAAGDLLALIVLALEVHALTGSGFAVAALFATTMAPVVLLAPVAGLVADRVESVRVVAVASLAQAAVAVALVLAVDHVAAVLALSALLAAGSAIGQPAEFALVPAVAGRGGLTRANGVMESARYAGYAGGPLLAALLVASTGPQAALAVNAASFLAIAGAAALMRTRRPPVARAERGAERARDGLVHLWSDHVVRAVVLPAVGALLFISASLTAEVFYVKEVLGAGDAGYAILTVAWMAGMVAGATGLAGRIPERAIPAAALAALAVQGAGMAGQTAWVVLPMALAGYAVGGVGHGVKNTLIRTLMQRRLPAAVHGRAFAAYNAARNAAELAALAAGGVLVSALGARAALVVAGAGPVVAGAAGLIALHGRRRALSAAPAYAGESS